ncbi:MAG: OmpA family protein [Vicingaceae bacterium]
MERGIEKYNFQAYEEAISLFKKAYEEDKSSITSLRYLANSYRHLKEYQNAEFYYTLVVNSDSVTSEDHLYFGQSLRANGKLIAAKDQFKQFAKNEENKFLGNLMLQSFDEIFVWELEGSKFSSSTIKNINTGFSEYSLVYFKNNYYFTSNREESYNSPESFSWDGTPFLSIFKIDSAGFNSGSETFSLAGGALQTAYHDGPLSIDPKGEKAVITRVNNQLGSNEFINRMKLYEGTYVNGKWKNFKALPFNSDDYSVAHACYADSGNSLIFASDMPGGLGGMDLYISEKINGEWSNPKNLGPTINTQFDEVFPYFKGNRLFFSSNGLIGYGGFDIHSSELIDGNYQIPKNLKSPINSTRDDFSIFYITDSTGFYASNREGGKGEDDIYSFYESHKVQTVGVSGVFEYLGLPVSGAKVLLLNDNDSIIAVTFTDSTGNFHFSKLAYQEDFFMQVETDDTELTEEGKLYLTNQNGNKVKLIERLQDGTFKFTALPADEYLVDLIAAEDNDSLIGDLLFAGNIYKTLPGDFTQKVKVYLVDDNGNLVDSVYTDAYGNFNFSKLGMDDNRKYFVQIEAKDELNIAYNNEYGRIYKVSEDEEGKYQLISELDPSKSPVIATKKGVTGVIARLEYKGEPLPFTKVEIYDVNNKLIATLFTNEKGEFQYNKLDISKTYYFKLPETDSEVLDNSFLYVTSIDGDPLYLINKLRDGSFEFNSLPYDEYSGIQLLEESQVPDLVDFEGVVYEKLPGDYSNKLKVYILNEDGLVVDSAFTDNYGKFNFSKLKSKENYSFRLANEDQLNLALLNSEDKIIELTMLNEKGSFTYDKLTYMVTQFEPIEAFDPFDVPSVNYNTVSVYGQVFRKLPGDMSAGTQVSIYDDEENFIGFAKTDAEGKFVYHRLKPEHTYYFKIEGEDGNYQILTLDEYGNVLSTVVKNQSGEFEYKSLPLDKNALSKIEANDLGVAFTGSISKLTAVDPLTVYYGLDSSVMNSESKRALAEFASKLKGKDLIIEVKSYTDSRGTEKYNLELSKKRTESVVSVLYQYGVRTTTIKKENYGEANPVVNCIDCDDNENAKNRRSIIKVKIIN